MLFLGLSVVERKFVFSVVNGVILVVEMGVVGKMVGCCLVCQKIYFSQVRQSVVSYCMVVSSSGVCCRRLKLLMVSVMQSLLVSVILNDVVNLQFCLWCRLFCSSNRKFGLGLVSVSRCVFVSRKNLEESIMCIDVCLVFFVKNVYVRQVCGCCIE